MTRLLLACCLLLLLAESVQAAPTPWEQRAYNSVEVGIFTMTDSIPFGEEDTAIYVNVRRCAHRHGAPLVCEARLDYDVQCRFVVFATPERWRFPRSLFGCPRAWWVGMPKPAERSNLNSLQQLRAL